MRALTNGGIMPAIRRRAKRQGITVQQALIDREMEALRRLLDAGREHAALERLAEPRDMAALDREGQVRS